MNVDEFYLELKNALDALGIPWQHKELVQVEITEQAVRYSYGNITIEVRNKVRE